MEKLRECPFCGGKAKEERSVHGKGFVYCIHCCDCDGRISWVDKREESIKAWNTRATIG